MGYKAFFEMMAKLHELTFTE